MELKNKKTVGPSGSGPTVYDVMILYECYPGEHTSLSELCHHQFLCDLETIFSARSIKTLLMMFKPNVKKKVFV
jgi:hypothetical protein